VPSDARGANAPTGRIDASGTPPRPTQDFAVMDIASCNPVTPPLDDRSRIRAIVAACSGNLVEWFDFYI